MSVSSACSPDTDTDGRRQCNSIYWWKTVYAPDDSVSNFVSSHNIDRLYLRLFDVGLGINGDPIPVGTLRFDSIDLPCADIVPTVYITVPAMRAMNDLRFWASTLAERIGNMCSYHNVNFDEIQLDFDWTETTCERFFTFCEIFGDTIRSHHPGTVLSSTLRLHQLKSTPPPVDRCMLMLYNTGSFRSADTHNSIIDYDDVKPYIDQVSSYPLPLDFAYPTYKWGLAYRNGRFVGLIRDTATLAALAGNSRRFTLRDTLNIDGSQLLPGDLVRIEQSDFREILKVKNLVERKLGTGNYSVALYHLDISNLNNYSHDEIENLYHRR